MPVRSPRVSMDSKISRTGGGGWRSRQAVEEKPDMLEPEPVGSVGTEASVGRDPALEEGVG